MNRKIDFSILIKKIFTKSSYIEASVLDSKNQFDNVLKCVLEKWSNMLIFLKTSVECE